MSQLFASGGQIIGVLQHQSFQRIFKTDFLKDGLVGSPCRYLPEVMPSYFPRFYLCVVHIAYSVFNKYLLSLCSVQFSSFAQSCLTLCDPMNCSTPGLPVHHQLLEFTQTQSIVSVMPSSHLILGHPLLLLPPIPPSIRVFSN